MQSTSASIHVGVIMDGNGRWALRRGLSRSAGHHAGVDAIRRVVEAAPELGIGTLSLFAFSSDNWARPAEEVQVLMALFERFLRDEAGPLRSHDVRLSVIGRRDRLPSGVVSAIAAAEALTARGSACTFEWPSTTPRATRSSRRPASADGTTGPAKASRSDSERSTARPHPTWIC